MGVIKEVDDDVSQANVWLTGGGLILCTNRGFTDMFGFKSVDLVGKNLRVIAADQDQLDQQVKYLMDAVETQTNDLGDAAWDNQDRIIHTFTTSCKHKYGSGTFRVSVSVSVAGTAAIKILVLHMRQLETSQGVIAMDEGGTIQYCSASVESMLGYDAGVLSSGNTPLGKVMPMPYSVMHQRFVEEWSRSFALTGMLQHRAISCASGRVVPLHAKGGRQVPCYIQLSMCRDAEKLIYAATVQRATNMSVWTDRPPHDESLVRDTRIRMLVRADGRILVADAPSADKAMSGEPLFGYYKEDLEDSTIAEVIDVFAEAVQNSRLFNAGATTEVVLPPILKKMVEKCEELGIASWRCGVRTGSASTTDGFTPACMVVSQREVGNISMEKLVEEGVVDAKTAATVSSETQELLLIELFRADALQGVFEIDKAGRFKKVDRPTSLLLGYQPELLQTMSVSGVLANQAASSGKAAVRSEWRFVAACRLVRERRVLWLGGHQLESLSVDDTSLPLQSALGLKLGKQVGDRTTVDLLFSDGSSFGAQVFACSRNEEGTRIQALVHSVGTLGPSPVGSFRRIQELLFRQNASADGTGGLFDDRTGSQGGAGGPKNVRFHGPGGEEVEERPSDPSISLGGSLTALRGVAKFK